MKANLISIGNSRGLRIPKAIIEQVGLDEEVEIDVRGRELVIRSARHPRQGWDEAFRAIAASGEEGLLDESTPTEFDQKEWTW